MLLVILIILIIIITTTTATHFWPNHFRGIFRERGKARRTVSLLSLVFALLIVLLSTQSAYAQTAVLRGEVKDESGAVVPDAKVTLTGPAGLLQTIMTGATGAYVFEGVAAGTYTVEAAAQDLSQPQPATISLKAGIQTLNLTLQVVGRVEKLTVQENTGPTISTDSSGNASALVLRGDDLQALSDNPDDLGSDLQALAGPSAGPNGGEIFVDGFSGGQLPAKESIREIRINQNPFSPEYDKLGYGRIEVFTRPGSDKYRGTVSYNFANDFWNSRNPYSPQKAPFLLNELEGNAGGPLGHRASFTVDAQRNMVDNGSIINAVTVDPQTFVIQPFAGTFTIPGRYFNVSPRVDYQWNDANTLIFRYGVTHSDVPNNGIGGYDLVSRGYHSQFTNQTVQASDTVALGASINETRFQYYRSATQAIANSLSPSILSPAIQVFGAFNGGGSAYGRTFDTQNSFELQNYTSMVHGAHTLRFGGRLRGQMDDSTSPQNFNGTFTFGGGGSAPVLNAQNQTVLDASGAPLLAPITSIERYRRTVLFQQLGNSPAQIRALGGGATQFSTNSGAAELAVHQVDVGIFAGDEWRMRPNLTLSLGLRYETQSNIHDRRDLAPRLGIAWAPGAGTQNARTKTVLRAGFGIFYDRFALSNTLAAQRLNGVVQKQYVVTNPDFFPTVPSPLALGVLPSSQVVEQVSSRLRAPYIMQAAFTLERQLSSNVTVAATYTNSHGLHSFRSVDTNAPLPGTFDPNVQGSGAFPLGRPGPIFQMQSSGIYNQNQLIANMTAKLRAGLSFFGFYVFNRAKSNSDGVNTFAANPYSSAGEYAPASTDVHHRFTVGGSVNLKWNIRISPFVVAQSGPPFDITAGSDLYGTTLFNGRPGVATDPNKPGLIRTDYGLLDPNPFAGEQRLPRNFGRGPGQINVNLRLSKTIGFGRSREGAGGESRPSAGAVTQAAAGGRGLGGIIGVPATSRRYNLTFGLSVRNVLNHVNPGPIVGNITSPRFGLANQLAGGPNGEGFYENANNRRLESQLRFTF